MESIELEDSRDRGVSPIAVDSLDCIDAPGEAVVRDGLPRRNSNAAAQHGVQDERSAAPPLGQNVTMYGRVLARGARQASGSQTGNSIATALNTLENMESIELEDSRDRGVSPIAVDSVDSIDSTAKDGDRDYEMVIDLSD